MSYRNGVLVYRKPRLDPRQNSPEDLKAAKDIEGYFRTCLAAVENERTAQFVESLAKQWDGEGWLSENQFKRLKSIHDDL